MSVIECYKSKVPVKQLCDWTLYPHSSYCYKPRAGEKGIKPSLVTKKTDGSTVANDKLVDDIRTILSSDFVCYGYHKITFALRQMNYVINPKKVYRLMDQNHLLLGKIIKTQGKRQWVKHRRITALKPMEYLCLDIKYLWVEGEKRYYYLLTILDVYSRKVLEWVLQKSIRQMDVIQMLRKLNVEHGLKGVNIRNDNGSQFIAHSVRNFLRSSEANQEFTHIATPEENSYIEAYHSIYEREVVQRFEFGSFYEAKLTTAAYVHFYNHKRLHGGIGMKTPEKRWNEYYQSFKSDRQLLAQESESMSRASANAGACNALDIDKDSANFANRMMNDEKPILNQIEKSVQLIGG
jgi:putative transposase